MVNSVPIIPTLATARARVSAFARSSWLSVIRLVTPHSGMSPMVYVMPQRI